MDSPDATVFVHGSEDSGALWIAELLELLGLQVITGNGTPIALGDVPKPAFVATRRSAETQPQNGNGAITSPEAFIHMLMFRPPWDLDVSANRWVKQLSRLLDLAKSNRPQWIIIEGTALATDPARVIAMIDQRLKLAPAAPPISTGDEIAAAWVATARILQRNKLQRFKNAESPKILRTCLPPSARQLLAEIERQADLRDDRQLPPLDQLIPAKPKRARISVVVPCFNDGLRLLEALASVRCCRAEEPEVVVVDDGSTDPLTIDLLKQLKALGLTVIWTEHRNTSSARNAGIAFTSAPYVLPLDADNLLRPGFITEAIAQLDADPRSAVAHSNARRFGDRHGHWAAEPFDLRRMLRGNYIDACAVIRRRALEQAGGYAETVSTMEDWDLWLKLASAGWGFVKLELIGFDYRVRQESKQWEILNRPDERRKVFMEVARRHERLFQPWWPTLYNDALDAIVTMEKESKQLAIELEKMKMREHKGASVSAVDQSKPIATPSQVRQRRRSPSRRKSIRPLALTQNRDLNPDGR